MAVRSIPFPPLLAALALAFLSASCSVLPPGMRIKDAADTPLTAAPPEVAPPAAATTPAAPGATAAPGAPTLEAKVYKGRGTFVSPLRPRGSPAPGPEEASLNFEALDIREVAKVILGDYLKESYTVDPQVTGTVTFRTVRPLPVKDLLPTLAMLLRQNNAAAVKEDGVYKILPISKVRGSVTPVLGGPNTPVLPPGFGVIVVPLQFVGAAEMVKLLEPFASDNSVRADTVRNLVILAGTERELRHLLDAIDLFDVDWLSGYSVGLFPIKSTDVKTLVGDLDKIFGATAQSPLAGIVRVIPIERLNALLVVTTQPSYLDMAKTWIDRIDQTGGTTGGTRFFVYQVKNGKAENLAQLVGDLFSSRRTTTTAPSLAPGARPATIGSTPYGQPGGQTTTTTVTPLPSAAAFQLPSGVGTTSSEVRVIADKDTNSLLILATPGDYDVIVGALRQLDMVRRQVLVEVLLAEVTLTDELSFGIDWFIRNSTTAQNNGTLNVGGGLPTTTGLPDRAGTRGAFTGLQLFNLTGTDVRAVLRTFATDGKTRILASPQIMVLDNEKAEIKVGDKISVQTQSQTGVSTGSGVLNSFQYLETGILLSVTPRINSGGMVTLEVNQEVSAPAASTTVTAANPNPNISTRNAKTSVVVANGESIVLGGLIREQNRYSSNGVPLLAKIPVIGAFFGTQDLTRDRTELVLVITPKIVSDPLQARDVTNELRTKLPSLEKMLPSLKTTPPEGMPPPGPVLK